MLAKIKKLLVKEVAKSKNDDKKNTDKNSTEQDDGDVSQENVHWFAAASGDWHCSRLVQQKLYAPPSGMKGVVMTKFGKGLLKNSDQAQDYLTYCGRQDPKNECTGGDAHCLRDAPPGRRTYCIHTGMTGELQVPNSHIDKTGYSEHGVIYL